MMWSASLLHSYAVTCACVQPKVSREALATEVRVGPAATKLQRCAPALLVGGSDFTAATQQDVFTEWKTL